MADLSELFAAGDTVWVTGGGRQHRGEGQEVREGTILRLEDGGAVVQLPDSTEDWFSADQVGPVGEET